MRSKAEFCLDASVALAFVFSDDKQHRQACALVNDWLRRKLHFCAPAMFAYECDSVIRLRVWKGKLSEEAAQLAREAISTLPIAIEYDPRDRDRAFEIARQYHQPRAYDAAYAAHAEARGVPFLTLDEPFYQAVNGSKKPRNAPPLSWVQLPIAK